MTTFIPRAFAPLALVFATLLPATLSAMAHDYTHGSLKIGHPWTRATPGGAKVAGGFMTITNHGTAPDRLIGGASELAKTFELHEMKHEGGMMKMRALEQGLEIKPGETVELKPGGYHVMFIDLNRPVKEGDSIKGELSFEKAGKISVDFKATAIGGKPGDGKKTDARKTDATGHDHKGHGH